MKAQIFSSIYSIIFALVILSVLSVFLSFVDNWENNSIIKNEAITLESVLDLASWFDAYTGSFNTSRPVNITINNEYIIISRNRYSASIKNSYGVISGLFLDVSSLKISKNGYYWVMSSV